MSDGFWVAITIHNIIISMFYEMALKCMACHREYSVAGTKSSICNVCQCSIREYNICAKVGLSTQPPLKQIELHSIKEFGDQAKVGSVVY